MTREGFEVVLTRDGAHAMRDRQSGELMHPVGPLTEARALYVEPARLELRMREGPVTLFDVGMGAGSNAAAAWRASEARGSGAPLQIVSFENTLAPLTLALEPAHAEAFGFDPAAAEAARALLRRGEHATALTRWRLVLGDVPETFAQAGALADVVFWDLYSTKTNPALWGVAAFTALRAACGPRSTVHTYAAATSIRSALMLAGFTVGFGPAIGSKRETTAAAVRAADLEAPLDPRWFERFGRSSAPLPADAPPDADARIAAYFSGT